MRIFILGALQAIVLFIIGVLVESNASNELLFCNFLDAEFKNDVLKNSIWIIIFLGGLNVIFYALSHKTRDTKEKINLYNNICQLIFDEFIKPDTTYRNATFRVSLFKAQKGIVLIRKKYLLPNFTTYLKNVGRYQTRQLKKLCKIKFLPDEGAVGACYNVGEYIFGETVTFDSPNGDRYYQENLEKYNLPKFKAKRLNAKSSSYICCPIKYFQTDDIFGVIVVDSLENNKLDRIDYRTIEEVISHYSVFFSKNGG